MDVREGSVCTRDLRIYGGIRSGVGVGVNVP